MVTTGASIDRLFIAFWLDNLLWIGMAGFNY
jgi:hypothetical protein